MLTKKAINNMKNRYLAVLKKCTLLNVFGSLALVGAMATGATLAMPSSAMAETNSGTINITHTPATGEATATGMQGVGNSNTLSNTGIIITTATTTDTSSSAINAYANGMLAAENNTGTNTLSNSGTITATATINGTNAFAYAYGMADQQAANSSSELINSGTINVTGIAEGTSNTANAYGMYVGASTAGTTTLTNSGTITATAKSDGDSANAYGMAINNSQTSGDIISNYGTITATAKSDEDSAYAYGIKAANGGTINNSGSINVTATATSTSTTGAYGIDSQSTSTLNNYGIINVSATSTGGSTNAYGIKAANGGTISNSGSINITATSTGTRNAYAYGVYADADADDVTISNSGSINVSATSTGNAYAYGIYSWGTSSLDNYGIINVSATAGGTASSYQAYINDGTATIGTWNMLLGEDYGTNGYYVFGASTSGTLAFNDDTNFVFVGTGSEFTSGATYSISDMISGTASGSVGSVASAFDFLQVELINPDDEYNTQSIKGTLNLTANNSPAQSAASNAMSGAFGHMGKLGGILASQRGGGNGGGNLKAQSDTAMMYADAGGTTTDAAPYLDANKPIWNTFIMPFYSHTSENSGDYSTDLYGLAMGASRSVCHNVDLGFHFSIAKAESESDYTDTNASSYAFGVHGVYNVDKDWYVRSQLSGFFSESDLDMVGSSSNNLTTADAYMDTLGLYMELAAGYDYAIAPQHTITPEIALSYMYAHMEGFDAQYYMGTAPTGTTFSMHSEDYSALYADASVRWTGAYELEMGVLKPTAKIGLRQALTNPEVSSTMEIFGTKSTTHSDLNETAFTCEAGLTWNLNDVALTLTYMGEFGDVEHSHMGMLKTMWKF